MIVSIEPLNALRARCLIVAVLASFAACGGGGSGGTVAPNRVPSIAGDPATDVNHGELYEFQPAASDPDGDSLSFEVRNLPEWATFDQQTGRLSGTPSLAHAGSYEDIVVSVSDGWNRADLPAFSIHVVDAGANARTAMLTWTPPTENSDGSPLDDLAGFRIYWGMSPDSYDHSEMLNNSGLTAYVIEDLTPGTWYFAATAINDASVESAFSAVVSKTIP